MQEEQASAFRRALAFKMCIFYNISARLTGRLKDTQGRGDGGEKKRQNQNNMLRKQGNKEGMSKKADQR